MIPAVGAVSLTSQLGATGQSLTASALGEQTAAAHSASAGTTGIGAEGGTANELGLEALNGTEGVSGGEAALGGGSTGTGQGGFGEALTSAISSLEQTQNSASSAAQSLATGSVSDPEAAVVTVEEAQLAMQLASQIRTKATEAVQQVFQTQV